MMKPVLLVDPSRIPSHGWDDVQKVAQREGALIVRCMLPLGGPPVMWLVEMLAAVSEAPE